jgi:hypothetical protein
MTKKATVTQSQIRRMIQAVQREGLHIAGIRADGTIVIYDGEENPLVSFDQRAQSPNDAEALRWGDGDS